ncbi:lysophospholipid acyltransferase family protein [Flavobacterium columnare]|uniref:Lipid A biosynthesis acyltransferase n=2 Tax=Flavobacterium TaxID=237 RepID=A0A2N9PE78_9FLAO|nr:lysophospholipid acyltransferase family protein [Flavobacterium columnare]RVU90139.1 lipid A biosynthesis acyltransferase [Flavobacterium columnare]SPE78638.1 Lipid A biosynthesis lauroyl acyltransferase [Flavobacterium columnare]
MQLVVYILVYPIIWFISILPFKLLYILSDSVYFIIYYIVGYRKKTVRHNLMIAFPNLSSKERLSIEKKSYRHLCDMFLEMIKTLSISEKEMDKRYQFTNLEIYNKLEMQQKSVIIMLAHYASYEWIIAMNKYIKFEGFGVYKKIKNRYFDKLVKKIRSKFNATLISTKETSKVIEKNNHNNILSVYAFISDQTPKPSSNMHWYQFMGKETPIHVGAELLAKRFDMSLIFLKVKKIKRGFYQATFEILADEVKSIPNFQISEKFIQKVEQQIYEAPEYYMWTHKRWKHTR